MRENSATSGWDGVVDPVAALRVVNQAPIAVSTPSTMKTAKTACPVSAEDFGGGCYRSETVQRNGTEERVVSLDTQPCIECGTCAIVAETDWEHPRVGKGVEYRYG